MPSWQVSSISDEKKKKSKILLAMGALACNSFSNTQEAETEGLPYAQGQSELHSKTLTQKTKQCKTKQINFLKIFL